VTTVYWANSIFGDADRAFNDACVARLRESGFSVLSPQEASFNASGGHADAIQIFRTDTAMIQRADVLIACIDQETIDCGVACELGIAWAMGKRLVGLYTDFRQHRTGEFRMYKNPYVVGCLRDRGVIVSDLDHVVTYLRGATC